MAGKIRPERAAKPKPAKMRATSTITGQCLCGAVEIETDFAGGEAPKGTVLRLALDPPLSKPFDAARPEDLAAASPLTRRLLDELGRAGRALGAPAGEADEGAPLPLPRVDEHSLSLTTAAPLDDPARARDAVGAMIALAESLRGERRIGAYR